MRRYDQLAALDSEVVLSAAEIQVKEAEAAAMQRRAGQGRTPRRVRRSCSEEAKKIQETFKPIYDSVLLYVKEEPLNP